MFWIGLTVSLAALDLGLKELVEERDDGEFPVEMPKTRGKIMLHKSHNSGLPFGLLKKRPDLVKMIPIAAASSVFGVFVYVMGKKGKIGEKIALSMVLGGALSNIIDRCRRGYVVDYFSFQVRGLKKVIFNLGDLFVFAGTILMAITQALPEKQAFHRENSLPEEK